MANTTPDRSAPEITLTDVSFGFSGRPLFSSFDFKISGGVWTCLLGPSGCGKSTLLRLISGSLKGHESGRIHFGSADDATHQTAWMAQKDLLFPWLSVLKNVLLGARLRGTVSRGDETAALSLIDAAGLGDYREALPATLSGGMRQRVALLRTLMEKRSVILMDEPFSALDAITRVKLQDLAVKLVQNATVLLVTHDPLEALRLGHRIHVMTGLPARLSPAIVPPGTPPRRLDDPDITRLHGDLLKALVGDA